MNKRVLVSIIVAVLLVGGIGMYSYAKYTSGIEGASEVSAAAWVINVNEVDINEESATLGNTLALTLDENTLVADGKIAPGRGGHFDITVDPTGTEVALEYRVELSSVTGMPAGMAITGYKIDGGTLNTGTSIPTQTIALGGAAQTITVYVEWANSEDNNADDTAKAGTTVNIPVKVTVSQKLS